MIIPDEKWIESKQVNKQIDCNNFFYFKILQVLMGQVKSGFPFTTYSKRVTMVVCCNNKQKIIFNFLSI